MKIFLLKEVCNITMGQAPPGDSYNYDKMGIPLLAGAGDFGNINPEPKKYTSLPGKICKVGDLILCIRATIGDRNWADKEYCLGRGVAGLRAKEELLDQSYLWHWLEVGKEQLLKQARGSTFKQVSQDAIASCEIPVPPIEEQRRIAAILDQADAVRRKRQEAIRLTEELLRATFLDMFGDPVTNPKGWETTQLENLCKRVTDGTHQSPNWTDQGIPFLFISNIVNGELDFNVSKYISEKLWKELTNRCPIEVNDILYTTVGSYGNAALVRTNKPFCFQRHIAHIKPDCEKIHPEFLLGMMQSDAVKRQADIQVRGIAQKTLNLRELKKFNLIVPSKIKQEKYVEFRREFEKYRNSNLNFFKISENLFNSLLQRAFRGEL